MSDTMPRKGQKLAGVFTVIETVELAEIQSRGIWVRHDKCGAEVFHILNDDSENLFAFAFATAPEDNTGAAHILEHSVFCGSRNYPLKDAFLVLAQGSLQTFLNAWTFPDKTVYPASSVNEHDYFNLMAVYGDAVFRPLLSEWTFMQEGHRAEFSPDTNKLSVTGVVYNEMKGAYSSLDAYAGHWSVKAIMPGTPYEWESGGDPEYIPGLSWEDLKEFHRRRYAPSNCRVFLAGNIDTEKQLAFLNERFFSGFEPGSAAPPIARTERWQSPKNFRVPCPAGAEKKATVFLSWLLTDVTDTEENIALAALTEILLGHDGSPLTRALVESGIGEDISPVSGLEAELRETLFVVGLRGVGGDIRQAEKQTEDLILGELRRLVTEGIPPQEIEAALLSMEFDQREIRRSGGPFSLVWMRLCLRGWLHGSSPWRTLLFNPAIEKIKQNLKNDKRYFESLIQKYFLDNSHRALVVLEPQEDFLPRQEARLEQSLADREQNLSEEEKREIIGKSAELEKFQNEEDDTHALAAIPHLARSDLSPNPVHIPRIMEDLSGTPALCHELFTNGITYIDLAFPADILSGDDYLWLRFFSRAITSAGLPGMDYGEVSSLLARTAGDLRVMLHNGSPVSSPDQFPVTPSGPLDLRGRDWIICRLKCLDEKTEASLDLTLRLLSEADFSDERHVRDLVLEMKSDYDSSLAPSGHSYASCRSGRFFSPAKSVDEMWSGLSQIEFAHRLAEFDTRQISAKLRGLREAIAGAGLIANITGGGAAINSGLKLLKEKFSSYGAPRPRKIFARDLNIQNGKFHAFSSNAESGRPEVFGSPSLQVGFAAVSLRAAPFDTQAQAAETLLSHQLSTGALWEEIRMKGGAYGAFATSDSLDGCFSLATYRDPAPLRSLESFQTILKNLAEKQKSRLTENGKNHDDDLVKMIIGCYARETRPRSAAEKGSIDFFRYLDGIEDDYRGRKLERLINMSAGDISASLEALASQNAVCPVIITGMKSGEQAAQALGVELKVLPA